jgi:hypothetical protein
MNNMPLDLSDIDEVFSQLEQFTPPADMVDRIMNAVSKLPFDYQAPVSPWMDLDELAIAK